MSELVSTRTLTNLLCLHSCCVLLPKAEVSLEWNRDTSNSPTPTTAGTTYNGHITQPHPLPLQEPLTMDTSHSPTPYHCRNHLQWTHHTAPPPTTAGTTYNGHITQPHPLPLQEPLTMTHHTAPPLPLQEPLTMDTSSRMMLKSRARSISWSRIRTLTCRHRMILYHH